MMQQQQTAPYEIDPRIPNYQSLDYTLIQPQSSVFNRFFSLNSIEHILFYLVMKVNRLSLLSIRKHQDHPNSILIYRRH